MELTLETYLGLQVGDAVTHRGRALVVATRGPTAAAPCGMCRQTLAEFAQDLPIRLVVDGVPSATITMP